MKRSRFSKEQIIGILKEHQAGLGAKEPCRKHGISDATFYKWRSKYGGMEVSDARRLKALETVNAKLKRMLACRGLGHEREELSAAVGLCPCKSRANPAVAG